MATATGLGGGWKENALPVNWLRGDGDKRETLQTRLQLPNTSDPIKDTPKAEVPYCTDLTLFSSKPSSHPLFS